MAIWVDADACPVVIRDILFRAAQRTQTPVTLVANHHFKIPASPYLQFIQVEHGFDVADNEIAKRVSAGDLVITSDIPLASEVIQQGATALSPRGELYTEANIQARLTMRDFMDTLRSSGVETGGQSALNQRDRHEFAQQLDRWLAANKSTT
jgi:uncharacterized protein YaiI (UPF0178 family)